MSAFGSFIGDHIYAPPRSRRLTDKFGSKTAGRVTRILLWAETLLFPAFCYFAAEYIHFSTVGVGRFIRFVAARPTVVVGMLLMTYSLYVLAFSLVRKAAAANVLIGALYMAAAITDHFKYALTGDFFYPWDLVQTGNVGTLTEYLTEPLPIKYYFVAASVIILALLPALGNISFSVKWYARIPLCLLICGAMFMCVATPARIDGFLERFGMSRNNAALQTSNYLDNGIIGGFTLNVLSLNVEQPSGYSQNEVENILSRYTYEDKTDDFSYPDIIVVLSESFWDPKRMPGSTFTDSDGNEVDPIAHFTEISSRSGAISGLMANTALGGGTVRPEFEVLTGLSTDYLPLGSVPYQYLNGITDSYVGIYKSLGYKTHSVHPYLPAFYSRDKGYPLLGIDDLSFEADITYYSDTHDDWQWEWRGQYISDKSFVEYTERKVDEDGDTPSFVMGISMEAHQPYETKYAPQALEIFAENDSLDEQTALAFRNYTMAMYDADNALGALIDWVDARERDTVVVYFGDHLPTLGTNYAAYLQSGYIKAEDRKSREDRLATQQTPFLIYSNFELSRSELVHEGDDNEIASYNLLNALSELIGSPRTPFMQLLRDFGLKYPAYNNRMYYPESEELDAFKRLHQMITYDRTVGGNYSAGK